MRAVSALARAALACLLLSALAPPAWAHRFGGPNDPCERKIGRSLIHITLFQPEFDPDAEYCDDIPREGNTVLVVDTFGDNLRTVPIGVQILSVGESGAQQLVLSIPPAIYRRGVVDTQVMLAAGSRYVARVSVADGAAQPLVFSFPILVRAWYRAWIVPLLMVLGVLAIVAISIARYYRLSARRRFRRARATRYACVAFAALALSFAAGCNRNSAPSSAALPDVQLIDAHGQPVALASLKGKVVLIDFIHIGCPGVCANLTNKFGQIADVIGPELGSKVVLVSVTNDPEHDRPEALLKLARGMQADMHGWLFLTGTPQDVGRVIAAFGVDNRRLPDGSPNHITRVFMLGPDLREQHEYPGMAMNSRAVASELMNQAGGAS